MKILYCVGAPRISIKENSTTPGPRRHITGFIEGLSQLGHSLEVYVAGDTPPLRRFSQTEETKLRGGKAKLAVGDLSRILLAILNRFLLRPHGWRPDVVYERFGTYQDLGRRFQRRGALWVVESNGLFFREALERGSLFSGRFARHHELSVYGRADYVVAVSEQLRKEIISILHCDPRKVIVVRNGVDFADFEAEGVTRRLFPDDKFVLGFVGKLIEWQAVAEMIAVLPLLPSSVCVCIVGDGPTAGSLESQIRLNHLESRVVLVGSVEGNVVAEYIRGFDAGFAGHTSSLETGMTYHSPLKLYEYAACGLPVVATASEALDELASSIPVHAFLSGDQDSLVASLRDCVNSGTSDRDRRRAQHARVSERFSWKARAEKMLAAVTSSATDSECDTPGLPSEH